MNTIISSFFNYLLLAFLVNICLGLIFIKAVDNVNQPLSIFLIMSIITACILTLRKYRKSVLK